MGAAAGGTCCCKAEAHQEIVVPAGHEEGQRPPPLPSVPSLPASTRSSAAWRMLEDASCAGWTILHHQPSGLVLGFFDHNLGWVTYRIGEETGIIWSSGEVQTPYHWSDRMEGPAARLAADALGPGVPVGPAWVARGVWKIRQGASPSELRLANSGAEGEWVLGDNSITHCTGTDLSHLLWKDGEEFIGPIPSESECCSSVGHCGWVTKEGRWLEAESSSDSPWRIFEDPRCPGWTMLLHAASGLVLGFFNYNLGWCHYRAGTEKGIIWSGGNIQTPYAWADTVEKPALLQPSGDGVALGADWVVRGAWRMRKGASDAELRLVNDNTEGEWLLSHASIRHCTGVDLSDLLQKALHRGSKGRAGSKGRR